MPMTQFRRNFRNHSRSIRIVSSEMPESQQPLLESSPELESDVARVSAMVRISIPTLPVLPPLPPSALTLLPAREAASHLGEFLDKGEGRDYLSSSQLRGPLMPPYPESGTMGRTHGVDEWWERLLMLCLGKGKTVILTGAGVSVESGIRAYRGEDGTYSNPNYKSVENARLGLKQLDLGCADELADRSCTKSLWRIQREDVCSGSDVSCSPGSGNKITDTAGRRLGEVVPWCEDSILGSTRNLSDPL